MNKMVDTLLSQEELERYSRQIILPELTTSGQKKLKKSKVLVVGSGGLGSPIILYLAAAGIGQIGVIDFDCVDLTNLQRQILFNTSDIGKQKAVIAAKKIKKLNPFVKTNTYLEPLEKKNAIEIIEKYDLVVDGTDNFTTRYLINDVCNLLNKIWIYSAIYQFEGQVSVFDIKNNLPCYRCLYPSPPQFGLFPNCQEGGILGALAGIIGCIQAMEAIKILTNINSKLIGKLFLLDAFNFRSFMLPINKSKDCICCSSKITRKMVDSFDYKFSCQTNFFNSKVKSVTPKELKKQLEEKKDIQLIDVREVHEREVCQFNVFAGHLIPASRFKNNLKIIFRNISTEKPVIFYCQNGERSLFVANILISEYGVSNIYHLEGGIDEFLILIHEEESCYGKNYNT